MGSHRLENQKWPSGTRWLGILSLGALFWSFLALDDITTDNATEFPLEYSILVLCGTCFVVVVWRLVVAGKRWEAMLCGVLLLANILGVVRLAINGRPADPSTGYLLLRISFSALLLFALWLLIARRRANPITERNAV